MFDKDVDEGLTAGEKPGLQQQVALAPGQRRVDEALSDDLGQAVRQLSRYFVRQMVARGRILEGTPLCHFKMTYDVARKS